MARIQLQQVAHSYDEDVGSPVWAVEALDHAFHDGSFTALLGPSGCGKTTLLKIMSGLLQPTTGRVAFDGRDVTVDPPARRNIAQVFQFPVAYDTMTVFDNLAFPLRNRRLPAAEVRGRVLEVAELLDLTDELGRRAGRLTPYARQRVSIGRGLVRREVAAVLLDEPLTALDPATRLLLRRKICEVHRELGLTFVYVTHDQSEAMTIADRVLVMNEGRVLQEGTPQELFEAPASTFVGYFLGDPGMNFLPCTVLGDSALVAGARIELPPALAARARNATGELTLGIRAEHVEPAEPRSAGALPVSVVETEDRGHHQVVTLSSGAVELRMALAGERSMAAGDACSVRFAPAAVRLFADGDAVA